MKGKEFEIINIDDKNTLLSDKKRSQINGFLKIP
jgi:hypothetical protein